MKGEERLVHHSSWLQASSTSFGSPFLLKNVATFIMGKTKATKHLAEPIFDGCQCDAVSVFSIVGQICVDELNSHNPHSSLPLPLSFLGLKVKFSPSLHSPQFKGQIVPPFLLFIIFIVFFITSSTRLSLLVKFMSYPGKGYTDSDRPKNWVWSPRMLITFKFAIWMSSVRRALIIREYIIALPTWQIRRAQRFVGSVQDVYQSVFKCCKRSLTRTRISRKIG